MFFVFCPDSGGSHSFDMESVAENARPFAAFATEFTGKLGHGFGAEVTKNDIGVLKVFLEKIVHGDPDFGPVDPFQQMCQQEGDWGRFKTGGGDAGPFAGLNQKPSVAAAQVINLITVLQSGQVEYSVNDSLFGWNERNPDKQVNNDGQQHQENDQADQQQQKVGKEKVHRFTLA